MAAASGRPGEEWRVGTVGEMWLPVPITVEKESQDGGPTLVLTFDEVDGQLQCREARFKARPGGREVRRADLRAVSIDDAREEVAAAWARPATSGDGFRVLVWDPEESTARSAGVREDRRTRRRLSDDVLRRVLEVHRSDETGAPTKAVAEAFDVAHRTASLYVQKAKAAEREGRL